jgi:hypothetical protein
MMIQSRIRLALLPLAAAFALAACGGEPEEPTLEAGMDDTGGGELIVTEEDPAAVPVELPETPMTPVPVPTPVPTPVEEVETPPAQ